MLFYGRLLPLRSGGHYSQNSRPSLLLRWRRRGMSHWSDEAGQCYAVVLRFASHLSLLLVQLLTGRYSFVNAFLTGLFLWPVMRSSFRNNRVKRLAVRTLWSALIALTTSCVNILVLTLMHGRQLGWVCLASCGTDVGSRTYRILDILLILPVQVIINALVVYWVTSLSSDQHDTTGPDVALPSKLGDPETGGADPLSKGPKVAFKMGRSKRLSPTDLASMQVILVGSLLPRSGALSLASYRSRSLPSGLSNMANHRPVSRSTSCKRCPLFRKVVPAKYGKRAAPPAIRNRPPLR